MALNGITPYTTVNSAASATKTGRPGELEQDDFLTMLVAQLQNQDPLNPMDSTEFTAQLAQFNQLEQLMNIGNQMKTVVSGQQISANTQAVSYIGTTVTAGSSAISVAGGNASSLTFDLAGDARSVFISIYDANGGYVTTLEKGPMSAGPHTVKWSAADRSGNAVSDGLYTYSIAAADADGAAVTSTGYTKQEVTGVAFSRGAAVLLTDVGQIALTDVVSVEKTED
ncbi:hypothetical protein CSB20_04305 [bacterium DOLZORAL124_64_63]|nr:MAG: hypothetical protein CSB20_04305 [bacterium DOLZORAL124_64_63]